MDHPLSAFSRHQRTGRETMQHNRFEIGHDVHRRIYLPLLILYDSTPAAATPHLFLSRYSLRVTSRLRLRGIREMTVDACSLISRPVCFAWRFVGRMDMQLRMGAGNHEATEKAVSLSLVPSTTSEFSSKVWISVIVGRSLCSRYLTAFRILTASTSYRYLRARARRVSFSPAGSMYFQTY